MALHQILPGYLPQLESLAFYTVAIAAYVFIVGVFYQRLSKRNLVHVESREGISDNITWLIKYLVAFPAVSFLFFAVLSSALFFMAKSQTMQHILLLSMTIVAGTRLTAYINEGAAVDLAKLVPLALLGIFIVDPSFFDPTLPIKKFTEALAHTELIAAYFAFVVVLEVGLRILYTGAHLVGIAESPEEDGEGDTDD